MMTMHKTEPTVSIPLNVANILNKVYLPHNPNKCRAAHPLVLQAVRDFKAAIREAGGTA